MKIFKKKPLSKPKAILVYSINTLVIGVLLAATLVSNNYRDLISIYLGDSTSYISDKAKTVCQQIEEEGMVLLQNNDNTLPLKKAAKLSLFGQDSVDLVYGGSGSGAVNSSAAVTLKDALEKSGFSINSTLWDFYKTGAGKAYRKSFPDTAGNGKFVVNEVPANVFTSEVKNSFASYNDAAIVVVGRSGGESGDIPTDKLESGYNYLELDNNELDTLKMACASFSKVVLLINGSNPMELGFLEQAEYANVKSVVWVGDVGLVGPYAIGEALVGNKNFSGRTVDTYAYSNTSAPSYQNFGDYSYTNVNTGDNFTQYGPAGNKYLVYQEGIYVGYRYYETRYADQVTSRANVGTYDYTTTVKYPFGYGLSYTSFAWSDFSFSATSDGNYEASVSVTNTGTVAGKDVVEIYLQSPYTDYDVTNGVEKSAIELVGFAKTSAIAAGKKEEVKVSVAKEVMKAYDAHGAGTYILDAGDYYFSAGHNAHDALNNVLTAQGYQTSQGLTSAGDASLVAKESVASIDKTTYAKSAVNPDYTISNQFQDVDVKSYDSSFVYLSRHDWAGTYPTSSYQNGAWTISDSLKESLLFYRGNEVSDTSGVSAPKWSSGGTTKVKAAVGKSYDDPIWDTLVNELSATQAVNLVRMGGYATKQIDAIGLPVTIDKDGPAGISANLVGGTSAMAYPTEMVVASTWNVEIAKAFGDSVGTDSINAGVAGWYAPAVDIHRSPFSGRNFEYFSEDGFLSGYISGYEMKGLRAKGVMAYMKHFALNDQETNRSGGSIYANEQAIREVFLKGFEYTVREGKPVAAMVAMNRIGPRWAGAHRGLMNETLRNEWGYEGMCITDQASVSAMAYQDIISGLWAGNDLWLNTNASLWKLNDYLAGASDNIAVMANVHRAAKNIIYAVAGSNAMNTVSVTGTTAEEMPTWQKLLVGVDAVLGTALIAGMVLVTLKLFYDKKNKGAVEEAPKTK